MACVYIPVQNSEEEVRVALDQLPRDATDILDILKAEQAPLDLWLIIAREYFKQGKIEQFRQILEEGSSPEIDEYYADVRYERIAILNALGAYYSYLGKIETKQREKEEHFILATQYYNKASRIDMHEPSTWIGKGQLLLAKGDVDQAFAAFKIVLDGDRDNIPALLGQACVEFNRGKYSSSLEMYKRVLQVYPGCPAAVRLGIGLCRYKLGQFDRAKQAFERVLQLDPENVEALVALGIMDLQSNEAYGIRGAMEKMRRAFDIYPYCATALNYLANHFFFTGQHFLVEQLTETALAATTHGSTRAHSYYNLARSYHSKGDYEKAGLYYMASVKEINKPQEFILPFYGLGQVQLKLGDFKSSLSNFEKVLEVYPENCETLKAVAHIYLQLNQTTKAHEALKKATRIDPRDPEAFLDLGELLIATDSGAALDAFKTARNLLKKANEEVSIELLNNIGVLHFERGEFELALQTFKEALGDGIWLKLMDTEPQSDSIGDPIRNTLYQPIDSSLAARKYKDMQLFHNLEKDGISVDLPWDKITTLSNLARLFEQLHKTETASLLYRLILFKFPEYVDAYLRLAAIAKSRNNVPLSIELIHDALQVDDKNPDALCMLGDLELKNDDWLKAKDTFRAAKDASNGKDSYATLCLGNWNYFAAVRSEKRAPKLEATHLEKAKELYTKVLIEHPANMYAANGAGVVLAEKGQFDIAKELFTQVQEAASGSVFVQMPDVWINLAHVHFAQGNFSLAIKMYQNCLRKFYYNTDSQILLYLARTHYEAEQWQDCKKTLLKAIHLAPSNYTLRFDTGVALQKFSASTLQKTKRTVDEVRATVAELKNAVRVFSLLSAASNLQFHGFDEKKIETHVGYCKHLLEAAKVHCDAAELEDQQNRHRLELARQAAIREEESRLAEEQKKVKLEKRKQEDELKKVMQQEQHLERIKEHWKSSGSKRKDRGQSGDEEGGQGERRRRKGSSKKRKRDKKTETHMDDQDEYDDDNANTNYYEPENQVNNQVNNDEDDPQDLLAAAGLEDSDADDDPGAPSAGRRIRGWSESEEDEPEKRPPNSSPVRDNSVDMQLSDGD
ncbi:putative RNA polymerase-associated protein Ctr9 [Helianthus annuus]|uniref:Putative binding protein n=1 Tax=Helianthus annuus TaxID=4232 RepID=A0A251T1D5_HELAN|nr:protein CTR9 homolog [Helianthus annuus]KAF5776157.1 putative RNA polymerase-associated protein Ctr9 [Helianthus annuus]KAJ0491210.1 putative RNA polymerase-associated protein Ctr9 [Helianthus annuus]KAJ0503716.1 putative RNA polymerase-associated protein Ctr9 [Helianthus annuus]KAJ0673389.1 putative RNA polymerase-associated protein Ctr9 [Helianthus annuus]